MLTAVDLTATSPASLAIPGAESSPAKSDAGSTDPENLILSMTEPDLLKKPEYIHVVLNHLPIYGTYRGSTGALTNPPEPSHPNHGPYPHAHRRCFSIPRLHHRSEGVQDNPRQAGGPIRHPEFRTSETPDLQAKCSAL